MYILSKYEYPFLSSNYLFTYRSAQSIGKYCYQIVITITKELLLEYISDNALVYTDYFIFIIFLIVTRFIKHTVYSPLILLFFIYSMNHNLILNSAKNGSKLFTLHKNQITIYMNTNMLKRNLTALSIIFYVNYISKLLQTAGNRYVVKLHRK